MSGYEVSNYYFRITKRWFLTHSFFVCTAMASLALPTSTLYILLVDSECVA